MTKQTERDELVSLDLTVPRDRIRVGDAWIKFKKWTREGLRLYVPSYILWNGDARPGWQVRIKRAANRKSSTFFSASSMTPEKSLVQAWVYVVDTLLSTELRPVIPRKRKSPVHTGVVGVRLSAAKPGDVYSLAIRVGQSLHRDRAHNEIFHSVARDGFRREAFNENYRRAVAARYYYESLHQSQYRLSNPITRDTIIPKEFWPDELPVPDLYERALKHWQELLGLDF